MKKYERIVEIQKNIGADNEQKAIEAINYLYAHNKLISVKELVELTGLSRSYFYKNKRVNELLKKLIAKQTGDTSILTKNEVFNTALESSYIMMERQATLWKERYYNLLEENERLREEIKKLKINK